MNRIRQLHPSILAALMAVVLVVWPAGAAQAPPTSEANVPVLAYYYIWFTPSSWIRAKTDLPLLGPYASDDKEIMRQHIRWAKDAGIDGFLVSWKHTDALTPRLATLVEVSREEHFKLGIIYEALDFYRHPLPVDRISYDFDWFARTYGNDPVFDIFGKPLVIWSGTWKFDRSEIERAASPYRDDLLILASEKQPSDYEQKADLVDGNAYYWSSVDPETHPDYTGKLQRMSDAVHSRKGLWIAPVAPGFDARHLGGQREVLRRDGATMTTEYEAAMASAPDAIGLISWNEFSENPQIEPSCLYGDRYLAITAGLLGGTAPRVNLPCDEAALATSQAAAAGAPVDVTPTAADTVAMGSTFDWDSSAPQGIADRGARLGRITLLGMMGGLVAFSVLKVTRRALKEEHASAAHFAHPTVIDGNGDQR